MTVDGNIPSGGRSVVGPWSGFAERLRSEALLKFVNFGECCDPENFADLFEISILANFDNFCNFGGVFEF